MRIRNKSSTRFLTKNQSSVQFFTPRGESPSPLWSSAIKTYSVRIVHADGTFCNITTEAVNPTVAVAKAIALVNDASIIPWDVAEVVCRVTSPIIPTDIPSVVPAGWDSIEAGDVW